MQNVDLSQIDPLISRKLLRFNFRDRNQAQLDQYVHNLVIQSAKIQRLTHLVSGDAAWIIEVGYDKYLNYYDPVNRRIAISRSTLQKSQQFQLLDSGHELWHAELDATGILHPQSMDRSLPDFYLQEVAVEQLALMHLKRYFDRTLEYNVERASLKYQDLYLALCPDDENGEANRMKHDPEFTLLVSLQPKWTPAQRQTYGLITPERASQILEAHTGKTYGDNLLRWSLYYLTQEKNLIGFRVLIGTVTGSNRRHLQRIADFLQDASTHLETSQSHNHEIPAVISQE